MKGGKKRVLFRSVVVWFVIVGLLRVCSADAAITTTGNFDPNYNGADPWHVTGAPAGGFEGDLFIGRSGDADLVVSNGSQVMTRQTYLANYPGGRTSVTVTGPGSLLEGQFGVWLGSYAPAELSIADGGQVACSFGNIGTFGNHMSTVTVAGSDSRWNVEGSLTIGYFGDANMVISDGGRVSNNGANMAVAYDSTASVTVVGAGSLWDNHGQLRIGGDGHATLTVVDGGRLTTNVALVQANPGGTATVIVTGPNSVWTNTGTLTVGDYYHRSMLAVYNPDKYGTITTSDGGRVETGDMIVWYGSVLAGDGIFKATQIADHGIIRPGNSIGTMTIDGNLTMDSNSVLETEVDNHGHSDKLAVTGTANIVHGEVKVVSTETVTSPQQYTIVEANSVSGRFDGVDATSLYTGLLIRIAELRYEPNAVLLNVTPSRFDDSTFGQTRNEKQVGSVLQRMADSGGNTITSAIGDLHTYEDVRHAYDQLSGQTRAPLAFVASEGLDRHLGIISNRLHSAAGAFSEGSGLPGMLAMAGPAGESAASASPFGVANDMSMAAGPYLFEVGNGTPYLTDQPWGVWGRGYGLRGDRETREGISGYGYATYGTCFGLDYRFSPQWLLGVTTGFSRSNVDHARSDDAASIDATHLGFYGSYEVPGEYVNFIADYADLDYQTRRYVDVVDERLDGDFGGRVAGGYVEGGLKRSCGAWWILQPLASFQIVWSDVNRFTESGGAARLAFDDQQFESYKGSLGAKAVRLLYENADDSKAAVEFRGRWLHEFGDVRSPVGAHFVSDPALTFSIIDATAPRDSALLGVGLDACYGRALRGFLDYDVEVNRDNALGVFSAGLQYRW
jgi:T5SS/PEP-CTERM-associated repeat protein